MAPSRTHPVTVPLPVTPSAPLAWYGAPGCRFSPHVVALQTQPGYRRAEVNRSESATTFRRPPESAIVTGESGYARSTVRYMADVFLDRARPVASLCERHTRQVCGRVLEFLREARPVGARRSALRSRCAQSFNPSRVKWPVRAGYWSLARLATCDMLTATRRSDEVQNRVHMFRRRRFSLRARLDP